VAPDDRRPPSGHPPPTLDREIRRFASAAVHELRTPLTALSGEVELSLRRARPADEYRAALERVALYLRELTDLTADLAVLGAPEEVSFVKDFESIPLGVVFSQVASACLERDASAVTFDPPSDDLHVAGHPATLARALTLLLRHAARYRNPGSRVRLQACEADDGTVVPLRIEASPNGFRPGSWALFSTTSEGPQHSLPGELRLRAAARMLAAQGAAVRMDETQAPVSVMVVLRRAPEGQP
jgi:signal transduction histidine kinase